MVLATESDINRRIRRRSRILINIKLNRCNDFEKIINLVLGAFYRFYNMILC